MSTADQQLSAALHGEALVTAQRPELQPLVDHLADQAQGRDDIRTEVAGTIAGSWFASPTRRGDAWTPPACSCSPAVSALTNSTVGYALDGSAGVAALSHTDQPRHDHDKTRAAIRIPRNATGAIVTPGARSKAGMQTARRPVLPAAERGPTVRYPVADDHPTGWLMRARRRLRVAADGLRVHHRTGHAMRAAKRLAGLEGRRKSSWAAGD